MSYTQQVGIVKFIGLTQSKIVVTYIATTDHHPAAIDDQSDLDAALGGQNCPLKQDTP